MIAGKFQDMLPPQYVSLQLKQRLASRTIALHHVLLTLIPMC